MIFRFPQMRLYGNEWLVIIQVNHFDVINYLLVFTYR